MPQNKQAFVNAIVQSLGAGQPNRRPLIAMRGIRKSYYIGQPNELEILHGIDLTVWPGEFVAIVGESGSGKSTLMNIIGVLDKPTSGSIRWTGWISIKQTMTNWRASATIKSALCSRPITSSAARAR